MSEIEEVTPTGPLPAVPDNPLAKGPEHKGKRSILRNVVVGGVALLLGVGMGVAASGNASELEAAQSHAADLRRDLETAETDLTDARTQTADLNAQVDAFESQVSDLKSEASSLKDQVSNLEGRISDLKGKAADQAKAGGYSVNARSSFGDGIWQVGEEIQPGTYRSPAGGSCYWARLSGFGGFDDIIVNGGFSKNQTVTISASDKGFETSSCGTWEKIG